MNRLYKQFRYGLEYKMVDLYAVAAIGAAGAPTLTASLSKGITSVARVSAGIYDVTLNDKYVDLLAVLPTLQLAAGAPSSSSMVVRTNSVAAATPLVRVEFVDEAGAAIELDSGTVLKLKLELKASSI